MKPLRTVPWFVRLLVALFMGAQLAGAVPSPLINAPALPSAAATHAHDHHAHGHGDEHHGRDGAQHVVILGEHCCALHAVFAGVIPAPVLVATAASIGTGLLSSPGDLLHDVEPDPLDRPPKPLSLT